MIQRACRSLGTEPSVPLLLPLQPVHGSFGTTPHSGRSTPSSSPSLRKRLQLLPSSRPPPEPEPGTMVEKGSDSSSEKGGVPGTPSTQSLGSRNFIRNSKKMQSWYSMLSPTYKQRNEDFRKLFSKLPEAERLIVARDPPPGPPLPL